MATTRKLMGQSHFPADNGLNLAAGRPAVVASLLWQPWRRPLDGTQVSVDMQRLLFLLPRLQLCRLWLPSAVMIGHCHLIQFHSNQSNSNRNSAICCSVTKLGLKVESKVLVSLVKVSFRNSERKGSKRENRVVPLSFRIGKMRHFSFKFVINSVNHSIWIKFCPKVESKVQITKVNFHSDIQILKARNGVSSHVTYQFNWAPFN